MEGQNSNNTLNISEIISSNGNNKEAWVNLLCDIYSDDSNKIYHDVISFLKNNLEKILNVEITLDILDFLVNYGNPTIVALIARWDLINRISVFLKNEFNSSIEVKKKIIFLSQKWGKKYEKEKNFQNFVVNYKDLQKLGIIFPKLTYKLETYTKYISEEEAHTAQIKAKAIKNIKENNRKSNVEIQNENKMKSPLSTEKEKNEIKKLELEDKKMYDKESIAIKNESNHEENPYHDNNNRGNDENNKYNFINKDEIDNENNGIILNKKDSNNDKNIDNSDNINNEGNLNYKDDKNSNNNNNLNILINEINSITYNEDINDKNRNLFSEEQSEQSSRYPIFPSQFDNDSMTKLRSGKKNGEDDNKKSIKKKPENQGINMNGITPNGLDINKNTQLSNIIKHNENNKKMDKIENGMKEENKRNVNKPFKNKTFNDNYYVKKPTLPTNSNPFKHNIDYLGLKSNTFDLNSFKRDLDNKIQQLNKWINAGRFNFYNNQLKEGIKAIINEIPKCEHMMVQYHNSNYRNALEIVRKIKMDIEQTCSRYESLVNDRIVEPFISSFNGNSRQYYFNKCNLLGNQGYSNGMRNFDDYYKGSYGYGSSGSNYNF